MPAGLEGRVHNRHGGMSDSMTHKEFTRAEVQELASEERVLIIVHQRVLDVTQWMDEHPGGSDLLMEMLGLDATVDFEAVSHSKSAIEQMCRLQVGTLKQD